MTDLAMAPTSTSPIVRRFSVRVTPDRHFMILPTAKSPAPLSTYADATAAPPAAEAGPEPAPAARPCTAARRRRMSRARRAASAAL
jgi:hypothetical protein